MRGLVIVEGGVFLGGSFEAGVVFGCVMPCNKWLIAFCWVDEATELCCRLPTFLWPLS